MNISTKMSAVALSLCGLLSLNAAAETQENLYDFVNNNLNLEYATNADWDNPTKGVISGQTIRQGDVVLTAVDGSSKSNQYVERSAGKYLTIGGKITLTADEGRAITAITFTVQNYKFFLEAQAGNGTLNSDTYQWTGNSTAITFDNENAANEWGTQSMIKSILVVTDDANADTYTPAVTEYAEVASIAEFKALEVGTAAKLMLNNAQVNGVDFDGTVYVEDATAAVEFYDLGLDLSRNDVLNGYIYVKRGQYFYDDDPEDDVPGRERAQAVPDALTSMDDVTVTSDNVLVPTTFELADLLNDENISKLAKVENVTLAAAGRFHTITVDDQQLYVRDKLGYLPQDFVMPDDGSIVTVTGIFTWNGMRYEMLLTDVQLQSATGVETLRVSKASDADIISVMGMNMGRDASVLPAGIYVQNGRKFIVK